MVAEQRASIARESHPTSQTVRVHARPSDDAPSNLGSATESMGSPPPADSHDSEGDESRQRRLLSDRLAAVDTLAAGLSHEINNPLTYTLINIEHVLRRMRVLAGSAPSQETLEEFLPTVPSLVDSLAQTLHGMQRVREVVRNLMTFSRGSIESLTLIDVRGIAESSIQMAMHEVVPRARLVRSLAEVAPVMGSEAQLAQVFLSLIVNAAQSIPHGEARQHEVRVTTRMDEGKVVVEVSDTGAGIAPEILPRIFDPFFTSRGVGEGTGARPLRLLRHDPEARGRDHGGERAVPGLDLPRRPAPRRRVEARAGASDRPGFVAEEAGARPRRRRAHRSGDRARARRHRGGHGHRRSAGRPRTAGPGRALGHDPLRLVDVRHVGDRRVPGGAAHRARCGRAHGLHDGGRVHAARPRVSRQRRQRVPRKPFDVAKIRKLVSRADRR